MTGSSSFFLIGPTATGKTDIAHSIAVSTRKDIISADSMAVYRGMDAGTAKPSQTQRAEVRYWCLDLTDPDKDFSSGMFADSAREALGRIRAEHRTAIVVGGSGLYIRALVFGLAPDLQHSPEVRASLQAELDAKGLDHMRKRLESMRPDILSALRDPQNPRRVLRAMELAMSGQMPPAGTKAPLIADMTPMPCLRPSRSFHVEAISTRTRNMFAGPILHETERLLGMGSLSSGTATHAIGYAEAAAHLRGSLSLEAAISSTIKRTKALAKRQMTWFRHQLNVCWIDVDGTESVTGIAKRVMSHWQKYGPVTIHEETT